MFNMASIKDVTTRHFFGEQDWRKPGGDYCFERIPDSVLSLLTGQSTGNPLPEDCLGRVSEKYERVLLFFVDALGWRFVTEQIAHPLVARGVEDGVISMLLSQFPSTTTAHVPAFHLNRKVGHTGIYEWHMFDPEAQCMVTPLPFTILGKRLKNPDGRGDRPASISMLGKTAGEFFGGPTIHETLANMGFQSRCVLPKAIRGDTTAALTRGAEVYFYEAPTQIAKSAFWHLPVDFRGTTLVYLDIIDRAGHRFGPGSNSFQNTVPQALSIVQELVETFPKQGTWTGIFADHGMIEIPPPRDRERFVILNKDRGWLLDSLETNRDGRRLLPGGGLRDMFLHVRPEHLQWVGERLDGELSDQARVFCTQDLLDAGAFGDDYSEALKARLGNLAILAKPGFAVHWLDSVFENRLSFSGDHGGFHRDEMEIPLIALP